MERASGKYCLLRAGAASAGRPGDRPSQRSPRVSTAVFTITFQQTLHLTNVYGYLKFLKEKERKFIL